MYGKSFSPPLTIHVIALIKEKYLNALAFFVIVSVEEETRGITGEIKKSKKECNFTIFKLDYYAFILLLYGK